MPHEKNFSGIINSRENCNISWLCKIEYIGVDSSPTHEMNILVENSDAVRIIQPAAFVAR